MAEQKATATTKTTKTTNPPKTTDTKNTKKTKTTKTTKDAKTTKTSTSKTTTPKNSSKTSSKGSASAKPKGILAPIICAVVAALAIIGLVIAATLIVDNINKQNRVGKYELTAISTDGEDQTSSIAFLKALDLNSSLELKSDNTCVAEIVGKKYQVCTYTEKDFTMDDELKPYTFENKSITIQNGASTLTFTRIEENN